MVPSSTRARSLLAAVAGSFAVVLVGCASSPVSSRAAQAPAPIHFDAPGDVGRPPELPRPESLTAAKGNAPPAPMYPPEVIHAARIELAREALVSDNEFKAAIEDDEAMQRAIAEARTKEEQAARGHHRASP